MRAASKALALHLHTQIVQLERDAKARGGVAVHPRRIVVAGQATSPGPPP
jgi:hypothetical protein